MSAAMTATVQEEQSASCTWRRTHTCNVFLFTQQLLISVFLDVLEGIAMWTAIALGREPATLLRTLVLFRADKERNCTATYLMHL